jgi:hypothetical protein
MLSLQMMCLDTDLYHQHLGKAAERMINERLYWWLENTKSLNSNQSGFRRNKQTMDQLIRFTQEIGNAYQRQEWIKTTKMYGKNLLLLDKNKTI